MTGIEAAAVTAAIGKAVASAASKDAADQQTVNKVLLEAVKGTPEFDRAVQLYGERVALRQGISTGLLRFFARLLPIPSEYLSAHAADELAEKLSGVPDEDLRPPKRSLAGPAIEGLGYAADEPDLRELYLELLARALDDKYADSAHPSFVEVIRQITSREAELLRHYLTNESGSANFPIAALELLTQPQRNTVRLYTHLLDIPRSQRAEGSDSIPTFVDNWIRLGLVQVHYDSWIAKEGTYDWVETRPEAISARAYVAGRVPPAPKDGDIQESYVMDIKKGHMTPTAFGKSFALAVGMFGVLER
jgi:hypothetical protein